MLSSYIAVPLTISYLNPVKYGIWITLTSFVGWFYLMDIGLGNGLRTNLLEAFAKNDLISAKANISNAYFFTGGIIFIFYILFVIINPFLKWSALLNAPVEYDAELNRLIFYVITFFAVQFVLRLINVILTADQKPYISELSNTIANLFSLLIIFLLVKFTQSSLFVFGICFSAIPVIISLFFTLYFFNKKFRKIIPSYKFIDFQKGTKLTNLSLKFFIVQISAIILYTTQNIIISQILGPGEVTPYNIVYKYFFIITTMYSIINTVTLAGFGDAYFKEDFGWIKRSINKLNYVSLIIAGLIMLMVIFSNWVYRIWIGDQIQIPILYSILMGIYTIITVTVVPYTALLNGIGKIKLQLYVGICAAVINIPVSIWMTKLYGLSGILIVQLIISLAGILVYPCQSYKIITKKAIGIWNQ